MRSHLWHFILVFPPLFLLNNNLYAENLLSTVRSKYPDAVKKIEATLSHVEGHGFADTLIKGRRERYSIDFAVNSPLRKASLTTLDRGEHPGFPVERVFCVGSQSSFKLSRKEEKTPYLITGFNGENPSEALDAYFMCYLLSPCGVLSLPMSKIMADPSFQITAAEAVVEGEKNLVKISFRYKPVNNILRDGWVLVAPGEDWIIYQSYCRMGDSGDYSSNCKIRYYDHPTLGKLPQQVDYELPGSRKLSFTFDQIMMASQPKFNFSLPYYGLPELGLPSRQADGFQLSFWLYTAAAVALVISIMLRWASRRREKLENQA